MNSAHSNTPVCLVERNGRAHALGTRALGHSGKLPLQVRRALVTLVLRLRTHFLHFLRTARRVEISFAFLSLHLSLLTFCHSRTLSFPCHESHLLFFLISRHSYHLLHSMTHYESCHCSSFGHLIV